MESSVHGRLQERILGWVAMPSSRGSSRPQRLYPALPHCRWILYHLNHQGRPDSAIVIYFSGNPWVSYENPGGYVVTIHWKDSCWSWNSNTLVTWCKELTHWKRPWCRERLKAGGEGDDRGWAGWMALPTRWTSFWVNSRSWWWTGKPGVLQVHGSQRVGHNWVTELNWTWVTQPVA